MSRDTTAPHINPLMNPLMNPPAGPVTQLARLLRDRRGGASVMFAAASMGFLGLVGLATEAGNWYMANRRGQNAADASAVAGAMTRLRDVTGRSASIIAAGQDTASRNGFTAGGAISVAVNWPYGGYNDKVEVIVNQDQAISFARLFNMTAARVSNRAVAAVMPGGKACVLALTGDLTITGNFTLNAPNCMIAGNHTGPTSVNIGGSSTVNVQTIRAVGGCSGCSNGNLVTLQSPFAAYASPTPNPYVALDSQIWSPHSFSGGTCDNTKYGTGQSGGTGSSTLAPTYANPGATVPGTGKAYCNKIQTQNGDNFVLTPGTYIWYNSDIKIGGGSLTCPTCTDTNGVSIVQLGTSNQQGILDINAQAVVTLQAGSANTAYPNLSGVVYYRENLTSGGGGDDVTINGGASTVLRGGFYFPGGNAKYNGNGSSSCTVIVGGTIDMNGTGTLNQSGCANIGTPVPTTQYVALVE